MDFFSDIFFIVGFLICLFYGIKLLIIAFQESIGWGILCFFIPLVSLIFVVMHWDIAKAPFLKYLIGMAIMMFGAMLAPDVVL